MKHLILSAQWQYSLEPFPAFRCSLSYGRNQNSKQFLPLQGVEPVAKYKVTAPTVRASASDPKLPDQVLYEGPDKAKAEQVRKEFNQGKIFQGATMTGGEPILPEGKFRLITTKEKGTKMIVAGEDTSNEVLVFVGCKAGFRGSVGTVKDATTAELIKVAHAGNAVEGEIQVIAHFKVGQILAFYSNGRRNDDVITYTWNGVELQKKQYTKKEWELKMELAGTPVVKLTLPANFWEKSDSKPTAIPAALPPSELQKTEEPVVEAPQAVTISVDLLNRLMAGNTDLDAVMEAAALLSKK